MQLVPMQENETMSSKDFLDLINEVRGQQNESIMRLNKFNEKIVDELGDEDYTFSVVQNSNNTESTIYHLTVDQCTLLAMRESKKVRRVVLAKLKEKNKPLDLNNPVVLRNALLNYSEQVITLTQEVKTLNSAIETITSGASDIKFQQASKILGITQSALAEWLREHRWDRYLNKSRASTAYSEERGYCWTKYEQKTGVKPSGAEYEFTQIEFFIKPKGMAILTKEFLQ